MAKILRITRDPFAENPRSAYDHDSIFASWHGDYLFGDTQPTDIGMMEYRDQRVPSDHTCLPVYLMDHSGLSLSTTAFGCSWDSMQIGWIHCQGNEKSDLLTGEIELCDHYATGNVWEYEVVKRKKCKCCKQIIETVVDRCSGFYGAELSETGIEDSLPDKLRGAPLEQAWDARTWQ